MYQVNRELKSVNYVLNFFPAIKPLLTEQKRKNILLLNEVEKTFLDMCRFFLNPSNKSFDYGSVYRYLNDEWVVVALKALEIFSKQDTYLIQKPNHSILISERSSYN
ncbi:hypothetical protein KM915_21110 [Cytobacillus oceanisediminis]|uniref:hypothetical protein n=1 Tax=Cytobacillus oceanisediminis TaxID=665099 RepID=UPI001C24FCF8|nr:hypothetical protein [Cytobacillus oceanisediminis]MBU8732552.1 hypothetical protein [Cytobacillus oceanisediminis]